MGEKDFLKIGERENRTWFVLEYRFRCWVHRPNDNENH